MFFIVLGYGIGNVVVVVVVGFIVLMWFILLLYWKVKVKSGVEL